MLCAETRWLALNILNHRRAPTLTVFLSLASNVYLQYQVQNELLLAHSPKLESIALYKSIITNTIYQSEKKYADFSDHQTLGLFYSTLQT